MPARSSKAVPLGLLEGVGIPPGPSSCRRPAPGRRPLLATRGSLFGALGGGLRDDCEEVGSEAGEALWRKAVGLREGQADRLFAGGEERVCGDLGVEVAGADPVQAPGDDWLDLAHEAAALAVDGL